MLFAIENLPYWILLGTGFLLFGFVIVIGGGDDDADLGSDFDADMDADIDVDADLNPDINIDIDSDADVNGGGGSSSNPAYQFLGWLGIGKAPLILLLGLDFSLWGLVGWMLNVFVASLIGQIPIGLLGGVIFFSSMVIALWIGSLASRPIGKIFASFGEDTSGDRLIGCIGKVSSARLHKASDRKIAQVDVLDAAKNLVTVNAAVPDWATQVPTFGDTVLVIERSEQTYLYFVVLKDSPDQAHWFSTVAQSSSSISSSSS
ncbi:MAG: DUF1449 domain-containing protein [Leptolyngbyaceae bacterium]|nr:DUF1449 domain-containing protein [Leptolyngbyaceae bacterium]